MIDLCKNRVCFGLLQAGILGPDGGLARCYGEECSNWEQCNLGILEGQQDIEAALNHPHRRRERGREHR